MMVSVQQQLKAASWAATETAQLPRDDAIHTKAAKKT
jgi:hypothetical protein